MTKTVTSLFKSQAEAEAIVSRLKQAGLSHGGINVYSSSSGDLSDELSDAGIPASDAHAYMEGVRRGGALVTVSCADNEVDRAVSILDGHEGALDLDEQQSSWRQEGWTGHEHSSGMGLGASAAGLGATLTGGSDRSETTRSGGQTSDSASMRGAGDEVIPIAEEDLHVGKREVSGGRVRIHSHVVERPVQEQVTLRDETVEVERRPASGRATNLTGDVFQERTVEVEEHDEQAVVSKEARVKEELVIHKDVNQRTETISDTVRRTEVDVEDDRTTRGTGTTGTDRKR
ncbi:MAG TPA: YsnF/AvaK domain-containing protein [Microvirga sp.]|jgi:uncharacterized protein (TIGR02271 family)